MSLPSPPPRPIMAPAGIAGTCSRRCSAAPPLPAYSMCNLNVCEVLQAHGVDVNKPFEMVRTPPDGAAGTTCALYLACYQGHVDVARWLLAQPRANPNERVCGDSTSANRPSSLVDVELRLALRRCC